MVRAMAHPLVDQLRFTRAEWLRALRGVPEADGLRRLEPMNSIGWIVAHLAWQEQRYFLTRAQDVTPVPLLNEVAPNGGPPTTPSLRGMLTTLTTTRLSDGLGGSGPHRTVADSIQRVTYHYWFHIGEILAIRQLLGHPRRPEFVGDIDGRAPWRPDRG